MSPHPENPQFCTASGIDFLVADASCEVKEISTRERLQNIVSRGSFEWATPDLSGKWARLIQQSDYKEACDVNLNACLADRLRTSKSAHSTTVMAPPERILGVAGIKSEDVPLFSNIYSYQGGGEKICSRTHYSLPPLASRDAIDLQMKELYRQYDKSAATYIAWRCATGLRGDDSIHFSLMPVVGYPYTYEDFRMIPLPSATPRNERPSDRTEAANRFTSCLYSEGVQLGISRGDIDLSVTPN